jgi:hypothetical protein
MSEKLNTAIAVIGIDIGKNSFHVVGHDQRGAIVLHQKWSRGQVLVTHCQGCVCRERNVASGVGLHCHRPASYPRSSCRTQFTSKRRSKVKIIAMSNHRKRPRDSSQLAKLIVEAAASMVAR